MKQYIEASKPLHAVDKPGAPEGREKAYYARMHTHISHTHTAGSQARNLSPATPKTDPSLRNRLVRQPTDRLGPSP